MGEPWHSAYNAPGRLKELLLCWSSVGDVAKWNINTGASGNHVSPVLAYMMDMCGVQDYCIRDVLASVVVQSEHGVLWKM
jgi:hypothetical protein